MPLIPIDNGKPNCKEGVIRQWHHDKSLNFTFNLFPNLLATSKAQLANEKNNNHHNLNPKLKNV